MLHRAPHQPTPEDLAWLVVGMTLVTAGVTATTIGVILHYAAATPTRPDPATVLHTAATTATTVRIWVTAGITTTIAGIATLTRTIHRQHRKRQPSHPSR